MKRILFTLLILLWCGSAWGATYYVNTATGSNAAAGTSSGTPWLSTQYAVDMLSAGDTLNIVSTATNPVRDGIVSAVDGGDGTEITITGTSSDTHAYVTNLKNVSHGATIGNLYPNGELDAWISNSDAWLFTETVSAGNTITKETTEVHSGNSAKYVRTDTSPSLNQEFYLPGNTEVTFSYWNKTPTGAQKFRYTIRDTVPDPDVFLQDDLSTWDAAYNDILGTNSANAWAQVSIQFTTNSTGRYAIGIFSSYNDTMYLDDISLTVDAGTYQWSNVAEKNYKVLNIPFALDPVLLMSSTSAEWTTSGLDALSYIPVAADLATCDATENSWFWDSTTGLVYYYPSADITGLHVEIGYHNLIVPLTNKSTIHANGDYTDFNYITSIGARQFGFTGTGTNVSYTNCNAYNIYNTAFYIVSADIFISNSNCAYTYYGDCYLSYGAGSSVTIEYSSAAYAWDDGFQAGLDSSMVVKYCIARNGGVEEANDDAGFVSEGGTASFEVYNSVAYGNYGQGIHHAGGGTGTVRNNIAYGNGVTEGIDDLEVHAAAGELTASNNIYGTKDAAWTDINGVNSDPLFTNAAGGDFTITSSSPAINAGTKAGTVSFTSTQEDYFGHSYFFAPYDRLNIGADQEYSDAYLRPNRQGIVRRTWR